METSCAASALTPREATEFDSRLANLDGCLVSLSPARAAGIAVRDTLGCLDSWMKDLGCAFVIVRPDHYVYATATSAADALRHLDSMCAELAL